MNVILSTGKFTQILSILELETYLKNEMKVYERERAKERKRVIENVYLYVSTSED